VLRTARHESDQAEQRLVEAEVRTIEVEGQYAEDHKEELEMERQKLIKQGIDVDSGNDPGSYSPKSEVKEEQQEGEDGGGKMTPIKTAPLEKLSDILKERNKGEEKFDFVEMVDKWTSENEEDTSAKDI